MPLRRSPLLTPRSLAARRANALKSTGPRTPAGKARVSLNALKHGQATRQTGGPARYPARFREKLLRAGYPQQEALYASLRACLAQAFGPRTPHWRREVDRFALRAWCVATGRDFFRTKLECALDSEAKALWVLSQDLQQDRFPSRRHRPGFTRSLRYRAEDNYRRIGVAFWIQRRRYVTRARVRRIMAGLEPFRIGAADEGLENRVRCLVFRLRRPGYFERLSYGLDRNGDPDWSREPWRSFPGYRERWDFARWQNGAGPDGVTESAYTPGSMPVAQLRPLFAQSLMSMNDTPNRENNPSPALLRRAPSPRGRGWTAAGVFPETPSGCGTCRRGTGEGRSARFSEQELKASSAVVIPSALAKRGTQEGTHGLHTGSVSRGEKGLADRVHGRIRGAASRAMAGISRWVSSQSLT